MKLYFDNHGWDGQFQRTVGKDNYGMANMGECLYIASQIKEGDRDTWYDAFFNFATQLQSAAKQGLANKHFYSAQQKLLRATEYFRNAFFYHREDLASDKLQNAYKAHQACFKEFLEISKLPISSLDIPFEGKYLRGFFARPQAEKIKRPTIIHLGGYDGTMEELYMSVIESNARSYNAYAFDGPGQGNCLYEQHMYMRPDWENVITPVIEALLKLPEVDANAICIMGRSFGGYLGLRTAVNQEHVAALILDPGQYDIGAAVKKRLPANLASSIYDDTPAAKQQLEDLLLQASWGEFLPPRMTTHGATSVQEYLRMLMSYTNENFADKVTCPTLVCDNASDLVSTQQGKILYDHLTCKKSFINFTKEEGAEGHCETLGQPIFYARAFDWLAENVPQFNIE